MEDILRLPLMNFVIVKNQCEGTINGINEEGFSSNLESWLGISVFRQGVDEMNHQHGSTHTLTDAL